MNINRGINHIGLTVPDIERRQPFQRRAQRKDCL